MMSNWEAKRAVDEIQRLEDFAPRPSTFTAHYPAEWQTKVSPGYRRAYYSPRSVCIDDLRSLYRLRGGSYLERLAARAKLIEQTLVDYPVARPQITNSEHRPRKPDYLKFEAVLSRAAGVRLNPKQIEDLKAAVASKNAEIAEALAEASERYDVALGHDLRRLESMVGEWETGKEAWAEQGRSELAYIRRLLSQNATTQSSPDAVRELVSRLPLPDWVPTTFEIKFDQETGILILEHELPNVEGIQWTKPAEFSRSASSKPANRAEARDAASAFYPSLILYLAASIAQQIPRDEINAIAVNGWVQFHAKATGALTKAYCGSLMAPAARLRELDLQHIDPPTAFIALKGNASRSVELTPIAPQIRMDPSDSRFVDPRDVLSNLADGENLASMDWEDFEHLCRELFERVFASAGATVSVTQASRDQGVDAIIHDPDPIRGGKMVIQAKRYVNTVDVSAVRDLWGTVSHEGAMKGLLVTTSQFGPDAYTFVQDKPLTLINGAELLYLLEQNGYTYRIDLEEARRVQREGGLPPAARKPKKPTFQADEG